jgi:hypothetical protein
MVRLPWLCGSMSPGQATSESTIRRARADGRCPTAAIAVSAGAIMIVDPLDRPHAPRANLMRPALLISSGGLAMWSWMCGL